MAVRQRGTSAVEFVIVAPVFLLLIFTIIEAGLYFHARDVALAAATDGLTAARARTGSGEEGRQAAVAFVERAGGDDVLLGSTVASVRTATTATVTVTGRTLPLVPGLPGWSVSQTASGPVERFTRAGQP